ncbi:MAG: coenzyme F420-0:L-glutamate ligase [Bryobacteraceae bacterium]|jgi:coenzyme F420-0:L-glutamate ligase/coenzyme F420-1:gamma-L-glutamate ligase
MRLEITGLSSLPEVRPGDDLASLIHEATPDMDQTVLLAVAQKIVSKAEGAIVDLREMRPSALAKSWAEEWNKDSRLIELILAQSRRIVKMERGVLISETRHGFVCANAGVDQSNVEGGDFATILPNDPDASALRLRNNLACGAVIITDTFGRPWREGLVDVAIGIAGLDPLEDLRGHTDRHGKKLSSTIIAVADQLAAAAGLVMKKAAGCPVALIRGFEWQPAEGSARSLLRKPEQDLFR